MTLEEIENYIEYHMKYNTEEHIRFSNYLEFIDDVTDEDDKRIMLNYMSWYNRKYPIKEIVANVKEIEVGKYIVE